MPIHTDYRSMYAAMVKKYGAKKGRSVFYAYCNEHGLDHTKPRPASHKSFDLAKIAALYEIIKSWPEDSPLFATADKALGEDIYGATFSIIGVDTKAVNSEGNYYVEGFISTPLKDLDGETVLESVLAEWEKECVAPPHNLGWLWHESPYTAKENMDKIPILRFVESKLMEREMPNGLKTKGLWAKAILNKLHPRCEEIWGLIKSGFINAFSAEFVPVNINPLMKTIDRAKYLSTSIVMAPCNDGTTITAAYIKSFGNNNSASAGGGPQDEDHTLEALLEQARRLQAWQQGPPVPGAYEPAPPRLINVSINQPPATNTSALHSTNMSAPDVIQPQVLANSSPPSAIEQQFLAAMAKITDMEKEINKLKPQPPPEPTKEEVKRVLEYLNRQANAPPAAPPAAPPVIQSTVTKSYTAEEVEYMVQDRVAAEVAKIRAKGDVVRKAAGEPLADNGGEAELGNIPLREVHDLNGLLNQMDYLNGKSKLI